VTGKLHTLNGATDLYKSMNKSGVNESQETKEPLSFFSSNHRVKLSGLCQLSQVTALQQQRMKEQVRKYTKKLQ